MRKSRYYFLLFLILFPLLSYSQKKDLKFEHFNTLHGLSKSSVFCLFQDSRGFIWIGTKEGLNRYDGYKFTVYKYDPENPESISNNNIRQIIEDKKGNLWIATWGGGLNMFDRKKDKFLHYNANDSIPHSLSSDFIYSIAVDEEENIWVGTDGGGLNYFNTQTKKADVYRNDHKDSKSISDNVIRSLIIDGGSNLWVGTQNGGLNLFNPKDQTFTRFIHDEYDEFSIAGNNIRTIFENKQGDLWLSSYDGGLNLLDRKSMKFSRYIADDHSSNSIVNNHVMAISEDNEGNLWIGTENGGLDIFNIKTSTFTNYKNDEIDKNSLSNNSIYSIIKDEKGDMWVGTWAGGLNLYDKDANKFMHFKRTSSPHSLSNNLVLALFEDSKKNLWVGTDGGGLNLFDMEKGKFKNYINEKNNSKSICGNYVLSICESNNNEIWIGTWGDGITVFDKDKNIYKHFKHDPQNQNSPSGNNAWSIIKSNDGNIWIGFCPGGLNKYDPKNGTFTRYLHDENDPTSLSNKYVYSIFEDSQENIWVGTSGGGLNMLDKKTNSFIHFKHDKTKNSISHNSIANIFEDKAGNFYISSEGGLDLLDRETKEFTNFGKKDGLPEGAVFGILEDEHQNLWLSTNKGLICFNPQKKTSKIYTYSDGLQSNEFNRNSFVKATSGKMYFGGSNGFNEVDPSILNENNFDPPIVFTDFEIFNSKVFVKRNPDDPSPLVADITESKELKLNYDQNIISLTFASLNYVKDDKKQYRYILEGFDKNWNEIGAKNSATYTNIPPGKYNFKVQGLNNNSRWSDKTLELKIAIIPPFWKTWWFQSFISILVLSCFVSFFVIRMKLIKNQKKVLEVQVKERTSEVVAQKEEIIVQREQIEHLYNEMKFSIKAAEAIQKSILPSESSIIKHLPESFILNLPKDVISGDFYWFDVKDEKVIIAAVDCTGHGVSGALMSINGHHLLNQVIYPYENLIASEILDRLNEALFNELHTQDKNTDLRDGMDIALCILDKKNKKLQYSGANSPLYLLRDKEIIQIKGDRFSIGQSSYLKKNKFINQEIELEEGDLVYIFSDGYADQLGGSNGDEKLMYPNFRKILIEISGEKMETQLKHLTEKMKMWKGCVEQLDDILVIGFKV